ncbi:uncharacterized protein TM35_000301520 [Trypanosoma theileri]|uniref:Uncharacterized protein n=1 Tax=Trypanosoma theileri TaxID=67003 RepID=A0A1X0NN15_9TRYP|nr:uncharacterized protein TM35_000301520 [Trypanosoma theileri]ORC86112.1 hypothetical protein TM35_000301520 [Trypanosoma theileri]
MEVNAAAASPADGRSTRKTSNGWSKGSHGSRALAATAATTNTTTTTTNNTTSTETETVGGVSGAEYVMNTHTHSHDAITPLPLKRGGSRTSSKRTPRGGVMGLIGSSVRASQGASVSSRSLQHDSFESRHLETPALLIQHVGSMSTTLRREQEVMDRETYLMLCMERQFRRHDPMRGFDRTKQDYVYYNHRSKGCYIPVEKPKDTAILTYNHMFDFGDGSRFQRNDGGKASANPAVIDSLKGTFKSLTKGSQKTLLSSKWSGGKASTDRNVIPRSSPQRPKSPRTVSVDLARSLQVADIRIKPFRKRIIVEDVIAADARSIAKSLDSIGSVVAQGKVMWEDVPESLRRSFVDEQSRRTVTRESMYASNQITRNIMNETQDSRYGAPKSHAFIDPMKTYDEEGQQQQLQQLQLQEGRIEQKQQVGTEQETTKREQVVFTDHADQVLLGFMEHVRQPVISADGIPSYSRAQTQSEDEKVMTGETGKKVSSAYKQNKEGEEKERKQREPQPKRGDDGYYDDDHDHDDKREDRPDSQIGKERVVLLPPVAIAQMREAEWFSPVTSRKPQTGTTTPMLTTISLPEHPLPYETSRLHFRRNYDVKDAKPLQGTIRWSAAKGLK